MQLIQTYAKELVAVLVAVMTWLLNERFKANAKVIWSSPHAFSFLVQEPLRDAEGKVLRPTQLVNTASIRVGNDGRGIATGVELTFNWKPQFLNLWPVRRYEEKTEADNRYVVIFATLAPKEEIGIEIMSINTDLPPVLLIRSDQCVAERLQMISTRLYPRWMARLYRFFAFAGMAAVVYGLIVLIQFLVLKTPLRYP